MGSNKISKLKACLGLKNKPTTYIAYGYIFQFTDNRNDIIKVGSSIGYDLIVLTHLRMLYTVCSNNKKYLCRISEK